MTELEQVKWDLLKVRETLKDLGNAAHLHANDLEAPEFSRTSNKATYEAYVYSVSNIEEILWNNYEVSIDEANTLSVVFDLNESQKEWIRENVEL